MRKISLLFSLGLTASAASVAQAEPVAGVLSEVRFGVMEHDLRFIAADPVESGVDFNLEALFVSPKLLEPLYAPRPHLGVQINSDNGTSQIYAGVTWTFDLHDRIWLGLAGGGTLHNGESLNTERSRKALGSKVLFRLSAELGVDVTENASVSLYFDHESNAFLADRNPGIDNVGARIGWRF